MSIKSLAALIGGIGVGMSGYAKGRAQFQENERQKTLAARDDADYERKLAKQTQADEAEAGFKETQADQTVEAIPSYDIERMDGGVPDQQPTVGYKANGQVFGMNDQAGAQQALMGVNSRAAKAERGAAYLQSQGQIEQAEKMYGFAKKAFDEGADKVIGGVLGAGPNPEALKKAGGKIMSTVGEQLANTFNTTGGWKVSKDTAVEYFVDKNAAGQEFTNARILGKDGKPVVEDAYNAGRMLMSQKERYALDKDNAATYQQGQQIAETRRAHEATEKQTAARDADNRKEAQARIGAEWARIKDARSQYKSQTPAGQIKLLEEVTGPLSEDDKKVVLGIKSKTGSKAADDLVGKKIQERMGTWHSANPEATPAQIALQEQSLYNAYGALKEDATVRETLKTEFAGLSPDSPQYAAKWAKAQQFNVTEKDLIGMGYKPPTKGTIVPNPTGQNIAQLGTAPVRQATARAPQKAATSDAIDLRADPTIKTLTAAIASLNPQDPRNVDQLMKLGTAKNARIEQLRKNYGSQTPIVTE